MFPVLTVIGCIVRRQTKLFFPRLCSTSSEIPKTDTSPNETNAPNTKIGGFAKAYEKQSHMLEVDDSEQPQNFSALLRNSKFMDLGDPTGKIVTGKIFHVVEDDLYIDFGWKFHCVCTRPATRGDEYVRGSRVRIQIKDLELSSRFLGSSTDLTLLEADCKLLALVSTSARSSSEKQI